jgi:FMN-dependent NADH-azoreductase
MKKLLFVNACINRESSRTYRLSKELISLLEKQDNFEISELILEKENILPLTSETFNKRFDFVRKKDFSDEIFRYSKQFKEADCIVIAAPFWDFGFPAMLKIYIESVSITDIVFTYGEDGRPIGLCKARNLYYITTRGSFVGDEKDLGFATIAGLGGFFGIKEIKCISADGFDIPTNNAEALLKNAINNLPNVL